MRDITYVGKVLRWRCCITYYLKYRQSYFDLVVTINEEFRKIIEYKQEWLVFPEKAIFHLRWDSIERIFIELRILDFCCVILTLRGLPSKEKVLQRGGHLRMLLKIVLTNTQLKNYEALIVTLLEPATKQRDTQDVFNPFVVKLFTKSFMNLKNASSKIMPFKGPVELGGET